MFEILQCHTKESETVKGILALSLASLNYIFCLSWYSVKLKNSLKKTDSYFFTEKLLRLIFGNTLAGICNWTKKWKFEMKKVLNCFHQLLCHSTQFCKVEITAYRKFFTFTEFFPTNFEAQMKKTDSILRKKNLQVWVYNKNLVDFLYQIPQILKLKQVISTFIDKTLCNGWFAAELAYLSPFSVECWIRV